MTEQEWLECTAPCPMLDFLEGKLSDRKFRLFACACCRAIWHLLTDDRSRNAVAASEEQADMRGYDLVKIREVAEEAVWASKELENRKAARAAADLAVDFRPFGFVHFVSADDLRRRYAENPRRFRASIEAAAQASALAGNTTDAAARLLQARKKQTAYLCDILGNPFHPVTLDPAWLTGTVTSLAQAIYDERAFDRLPILADALEDAGCSCSGRSRP